LRGRFILAIEAQWLARREATTPAAAAGDRGGVTPAPAGQRAPSAATIADGFWKHGGRGILKIADLDRVCNPVA
jgi:hypothetical protein